MSARVANMAWVTQATCIEMNTPRIVDSNENQKESGVDDVSEFVTGDTKKCSRCPYSERVPVNKRVNFIEEISPDERFHKYFKLHACYMKEIVL